MVATCKALLDGGAAIRLPSDVTALGPGGEIGDPAAGGDVRQLGTHDPRRLDGPRHRPGHRRPSSPTSIARRPHRVLERARWACSRTRGSRPAPARWPRPWPSPAASPSSVGATPPPRSPSSASPTASTTSAPAAAPRSSCSSRATSRASPPSERAGTTCMSPTDRKPLISGNWKMHHNHFEALQLVQKLSYLLTDGRLRRRRRVGAPAVHRPAHGADLLHQREGAHPDRARRPALPLGGARARSPARCRPAMLAKLDVALRDRRPLRAARAVRRDRRDGEPQGARPS